MDVISGAKAALQRVGLVEASTADLVPPPQLASPWSDSDHLNTVVWSDIFGQSEDLPLTRSEAMAVPAVARARNIIATTLGRLPLEALDRSGEASTVQPTVLVQPDPDQPRFITMTWLVDDLIFHGVSWFLVLRRLAYPGRPLHIRRLHPGTVDPVPDHNGYCSVAIGASTRRVHVRDLVRIDGPHEGILRYAARTLRHARALEQSAKRFADNPVPAIELHQTSGVPIPQPERDQLIGAWAEARRGANGGVAYTSPNIEAKVHGSPAENLLTHGRNAAAIDAARVAGVPADAIDATPEHTSMTYANVETRGRVLIDYGLAAYAAAVEGRLSMDDVLPYGTTVRWDLSSITAPSATQSPPEVST